METKDKQEWTKLNQVTKKPLDRGICKPVVAERYADNGQLSHYDVVDSSDGETIYTDILIEQQAKNACNMLKVRYYDYTDRLFEELDNYYDNYTIT